MKVDFHGFPQNATETRIILPMVNVKGSSTRIKLIPCGKSKFQIRIFFLFHYKTRKRRDVLPISQYTVMLSNNSPFYCINQNNHFDSSLESKWLLIQLYLVYYCLLNHIWFTIRFQKLLLPICFFHLLAK